MKVIRRPAALASSFPHFILLPLFAFPPAGAADKLVLPEGMQSVNFECCYGLTGTADLGRSEVYIYLICFETSRSTSFNPHIVLPPPVFFSPTSSLCALLAGDITQWHLPVGMEDLNLSLTEVTGKATSE